MDLKDKIAKLTQFPWKSRVMNYQSYYLNGEEVPGSRNTMERMELMKIPLDMFGMSVLDLGCNLGEIANECYRIGALPVMGLDYEKDYIECAKELAIQNKYNINYVQTDLTNVKESIDIINSFFGEKPIDIIFALSLYKHIKGIMFEVLDGLNFVQCVVESNNSPQGLQTPHVIEIIKHIEDRKWEWEHIGTDITRSPRIIFKVTK